MEVKLLHYTPLWVCAYAIRKSKNSYKYSDTTDAMIKKNEIGKKDFELINRVGNQYKHESVLEHIVYTFDIDGISRALLQELSRHRIASLTVKSTRYTLNELRTEPPFITGNVVDFKRAAKYLVFVGDEYINLQQIKHLEDLRYAIANGVVNDLAKYIVPESYKTSLILTINMRSLQNLLDLRTSPQALKEFKTLALKIYEVLPEKHKKLVEHKIHWE